MGRRSFSQYDLYGRCPERYRIQRVLRVPEPPSIWLPAGSAAGEACDKFDETESETEAMNFFIRRFEELVVEAELEHGMSRDKFEVNGVTKGERPDGKNYTWWVENFGEMLEKYVKWRDTSGYVLAEVDGKPAVELEVRLDLGQDTQVVGYLDRLFIRPDGKYEVLDLKAGVTQPGIYQLATYAYGMKIQYGLDVEYGSFFMLAKGGHSTPKWLPPYTNGNTVQQTYRRLDEAIKAGHYVPKVGGDCFRCPVAHHCDFVGRPGA